MRIGIYNCNYRYNNLSNIHNIPFYSFFSLRSQQYCTFRLTAFMCRTAVNYARYKFRKRSGQDGNQCDSSGCRRSSCSCCPPRKHWRSRPNRHRSNTDHSPILLHCRSYHKVRIHLVFFVQQDDSYRRCSEHTMQLLLYCYFLHKCNLHQLLLHAAILLS